MTDATRQPIRESQAPKSRAESFAACRSTLRCCRAVSARLLHIAASGLSLPRASAESETTSPDQRVQTGIYGEASTQPGSARADVRCGQRIIHQRGGQPSVARAAAARARAWVSRNQFGHVPCSWNIDSIVCRKTNSRTRTSCSCRIDASQSEERVRSQRIQPQE